MRSEYVHELADALLTALNIGRRPLAHAHTPKLALETAARLAALLADDGQAVVVVAGPHARGWFRKHAPLVAVATERALLDPAVVQIWPEVHTHTPEWWRIRRAESPQARVAGIGVVTWHRQFSYGNADEDAGHMFDTFCPAPRTFEVLVEAGVFPRIECVADHKRCDRVNGAPRADDVLTSALEKPGLRKFIAQAGRVIIHTGVLRAEDVEDVEDVKDVKDVEDAEDIEDVEFKEATLKEIVEVVESQGYMTHMYRADEPLTDAEHDAWTAGQLVLLYDGADWRPEIQARTIVSFILRPTDATFTRLVAPSIDADPNAPIVLITRNGIFDSLVSPQWFIYPLPKDAIKCKACGGVTSKKKRRCQHCEAVLPFDCPRCGEYNPAGKVVPEHVVCKFCGYDLSNNGRGLPFRHGHANVPDVRVPSSPSDEWHGWWSASPGGYVVAVGPDPQNGAALWLEEGAVTEAAWIRVDRVARPCGEAMPLPVGVGEVLTRLHGAATPATALTESHRRSLVRMRRVDVNRVFR